MAACHLQLSVFVFFFRVGWVWGPKDVSGSGFSWCGCPCVESLGSCEGVAVVAHNTTCGVWEYNPKNVFPTPPTIKVLVFLVGWVWDPTIPSGEIGGVVVVGFLSFWVVPAVVEESRTHNSTCGVWESVIFFSPTNHTIRVSRVFPGRRSSGTQGVTWE